MKKILLIISLVIIISGCQTIPENTNQGSNNQNNNQNLNQNINDSNVNDSEKETNQNVNQISESETEDASDWETYNEGTFSLKYPSEVVIAEHYLNPNRLTMTINKRWVQELNFPLGYDKETAEKDIQALKEGSFGQHMAFSLEESEKVIEIDGTTAKSFMVLGRFEVCDVTFERTVIFYIGEGEYLSNYHQIVITLSGPEGVIINSMENYFTTNEANCGDEKIWDLDDESTREKFYETLVAGDGSEIAQNWYGTFDKILETIELDN